jgi:HAD superfamily hydrolase (TIGR01548 family)
MDGVLADVSRSYRAAILETARAYGVTLHAEEISQAKRAGDANDDWALTHGLLARHGVEASLAEVTERFETIYQGTERKPGLRATESLLVETSTLERWRSRVPLGVVTGRPLSDAERFLEAAGVRGLFDVLVTREDAPLKPDPAPLGLALERLGVEHAWYVGDTVDDVSAARAAGLLPLGVVAPGEEADEVRAALVAAGAARMMNGPQELEEILP